MDSGTVKAGKPRAARGQIQELRNTGLSHYKYPWKSDGGGREQEQVVGGPCMYITSLEQSLWGHEPCVLYSKSTFTQRRDNCLFLRLDAPLPHAKDWFISSQTSGTIFLYNIMRAFTIYNPGEGGEPLPPSQTWQKIFQSTIREKKNLSNLLGNI